MASYSNARAIRALFTASLQSILKSPSAIFFSIAFPLIFILVFGFLGGSNGYSIPVTAARGSDTMQPLFRELMQMPALKWKVAATKEDIDKLMREGEIAATISVQEQPEGILPKTLIIINGSSSQMDKVQQLQSIIATVIQSQDPEIQIRANSLARIDIKMAQVREFRMIDFILPGQLGFSLLAAGVFGTAFVFFNLRQTLVLKRFFATPVRKSSIVLSEGLSRMFFQLTGAIIIISVGHFVFGFTLVHGWITFINMLLMCALAMMVFMGFGFLVSSLVKNETSIPPFSNLITLPQFLLAGTFFSIDNFPTWLQPVCRILPLTYLNDALRKIAFDGAGFWEIKWDVILLIVWGVVVYGITAKVFKWEA
ncbi:MAG TPA: ABC transporter permease [Flavipsychrobacter sp.]|nr:ABC transporter permease [Flavipsychrobacter sp.]